MLAQAYWAESRCPKTKSEKALKKSLLILVTNPRIVSGVLTEDFLAIISREYHLTICCSSDIKNSLLDELPYRVIRFQESRFRLKIQKLVLDLETLLESEKNISFNSRIHLLLGVPIRSKISLKTVLQFRSRYGLALVMIKFFFRNQQMRFLARFLSDKLSGLNKLNFDNKPSAMLIFSGGNYSGFENSAIYISNKKQIASILIIDNWDNLSSKSVIWNRPHYAAVWGEDMSQDAIKIQNISRERIIRIGSPRVSRGGNSRRLRLKESGSILFAGSGLQHSDEISLLLECSTALSKTNSNRCLVYRPHPYGLTPGEILRINEQIKNHKNISLAFDATDNLAENFYTKKSFESLSQSIDNADLIIGTHSTVLVEALAHGRQVIAYSMAEFGVFHGSSVWDNYAHLSRLRLNRNVREAHTRREFLDLIIHFEPNPCPENLAPEIIYEDELTYSERIMNALNLVISNLD